MRVPLPVVILLVLSVIGGTWWWNTRGMDFMTPPTEGKLEEIRVRVESSFPRADETDDAISAPPPPPQPPPPPPEPPKPEIDLGDLSVPPALQDYGVRAPQGAAPMIELAKALEEKGEFQRALLAWERVLDLTKPTETEAATALSSIKRLRPTLPDWNGKPEAAITITLQASSGWRLAKPLKTALDEVAKDLQTASSGIVKIKPVFTQGKNSPKGATPVAISLAGPDKKSTTTEVLSFTVQKPENLRAEIQKSVFTLVRAHLDNATAYTPPATLADGENPGDALSSRVTRLCWHEFATALNLPKKKP